MRRVQGSIAHKKAPCTRTLPSAYAEGPVVALSGVLFLMSEVPLYEGEKSLSII